ncbi:Fe-S cluster assembly protein SufD [Leptolyngbya sp. FACHB-711]|uniref:Fe-S cluster assembly protein SufD n=1 Tax=unclassified Leptolyngbya TaxID=2650499 RepID=UPI0016890D2D|nr:Fe-S cluster assembly protein SufD [Leptolyngbya sp. FACHB-711]MBD1851636.1 Fe-S cluster assembly protein SufD [Cyanobacteria bacterium FACHB-502]MBD2023557.1 Fe-S cluster assembly protein SufD [Leptolyngbya sp. FACHB-711]
MSIQVSSVPEQTGVSNAAQQRLDFANHLIELTKQSLSGGWLQSLRARALALIQEQSFPTTKDEEWRFTDLSELVKLRFEQIDRRSAVNVDAVTQFALVEESTRLVFVNGMYAPELSTILPSNGLTVTNLSALSETQRESLQNYLGQQPGSEELFTALNTAGISDAAVIKAAKNQAIDAPVHLLFVSTTRSTPTFIQPRVLVIAEPNSELTIVEEYVSIGEEQSFTNSVTEIFLAENAQISHTRIQRESLAAFHIGKTAVSQARTARYTCNAIDLGGKLSRHHLEIYQTGEQTETNLNGLTFISGEQLSDTHSTIALTQPYGTTRQLHKCIVDDRAHAVFNGKVFVPQAAQQTDAGQLNRNLLLSSKARVDTKPQLEIVADNVKCTHGATVSQLDDDEIFYLRSRGIDAASAERLLVYAFAYEVIDRVPVESLKQSLIAFAKNYHSRPCGIR